jgi:hypothetical protein
VSTQWSLLDVLPPEARRRYRKLKIAEPRPTCNFCGRRVPVHALVKLGGKLVKPTYRNGLFGMRTFRPHGSVVLGERKPCPGSGQKLVVARGFDR